MSELVRIGSLLPGLPSRRRPDMGAASARAAWPEAVGPEVARHSHPMRLTGETLVVHCSSSTWASELSLLGPHVLARLQEALGEAAPAALRFEVGELPPPPAAPPEVVSRALDPARAARARSVSEAVSDDRLRAAVRRAMRASSESES